MRHHRSRTGLTRLELPCAPPDSPPLPCREWDWGSRQGKPEAMTALRTALAADPAFHVLVRHGVDDLILPYFGTKLLLSQLPGGFGDRVHLALHDGGHMFHTVEASRHALHDEVRPGHRALRKVGTMRFVTILAVGLAAIPACAAPPTPGLPPALLPLLTRPDHVAALQRAARAVDPPGLPPCPSASYTTTGEIGVLAPVETDSSGAPIGGVIKEGIHATGCGMDRLLNALTVIEPNGALNTEALLPGTTITDPQLQQDSVPYAAGAMGQMPAGCEQGGVVNTRFVGVDGEPPGTRPVAGGPPRPWTEVWTLQACAKRADVTMHFIPDQTGTEIRAEPAK